MRPRRWKVVASDHMSANVSVRTDQPSRASVCVQWVWPRADSGSSGSSGPSHMAQYSLPPMPQSSGEATQRFSSCLGRSGASAPSGCGCRVWQAIAGKGHGCHSKPSSLLCWNVWTGSTTADCWSPSATSRPPKPSNATTPCWTIRRWRRNSLQPACDNPAAVHSGPIDRN